MTARPTILFSAFRPGTDPLRESWARFRDQLHSPQTSRPTASVGSSLDNRPARPTATKYGESGIWRLLAPNNRELGRSAFVYATFTAAHAHVSDMVSAADALVSRVVKAPMSSSYGWILSLNGASIMTCSRWHPSAVSAQDGARAALQALAVADVSSAPLRTTTSGRRTSKALEHPSIAQW